MLKMLLMVCLYLASSTSFTIDEESSPMVGDWKDAVDAKGLIRIPLLNPNGHAWFLSLRMGTDL